MAKEFSKVTCPLRDLADHELVIIKNHKQIVSKQKDRVVADRDAYKKKAESKNAPAVVRSIQKCQKAFLSDNKLQSDTYYSKRPETFNIKKLLLWHFPTTLLVDTPPITIKNQHVL